MLLMVRAAADALEPLHTTGCGIDPFASPCLIAQQAARHAAAHAALAQHRHLLRRRQVLVLRLVRLLPLAERLSLKPAIKGSASLAQRR